MDLPEYEQLALFEVDGEAYWAKVGQEPTWGDVRYVGVPVHVAEWWGYVAGLAAGVQKEVFAYLDAAQAASSSDLAPAFTD